MISTCHEKKVISIMYKPVIFALDSKTVGKKNNVKDLQIQDWKGPCQHGGTFKKITNIIDAIQETIIGLKKNDRDFKQNGLCCFF